MAKMKRARMQKVNVLLFAEDVEAIKDLAKAEKSLEWHPKLRQIVSLGLDAAKKRRIIK